MTGLAQVHGGQNWVDALVVVGGMVCLFGVAYLDALRAARKAERSRALVDAAAEPDHATCEHEGCEAVLCFCKAPALCEGAEEPGCGHLEFLCDAHLAECRECLAEARVFDTGSTW